MKLTPLEPWIQSRIGSRSQRLLRSDLEATQLEGLRRTIRWGREKSRFYLGRLADAPAEISRLEDLVLYPFTTPEDLRAEGGQLLCVPQGEIQRVVTLYTSGTTGSPKRIYFTREDQELTVDFFQHGMSTFTSAGDQVMILLPFERPGSVGDLLRAGLERLEAFPACYGPVRDPEHALAVMQSEHADVLVGAPVQILTLARFWDAGKGSPRGKPSQVLLSTDHVPRAIVAALEGIWGCTVYNHYGSTEMGLGGGVECQARNGYHLREADLYFEIVHPQTGRPLAEGEQGEIVFTTLTRVGMPLIRYRTGDLSRFIPGECPCGTVLRTMEKVTRRLNGEVVLDVIGEADSASEQGSPHLSMADLDEALFSLPQIVNFTARLARQDGKDQLEIWLITRPGASGDLINQALYRLESLPAIRAAREACSLELRIQMREYESASAGSLAKRTIMDERGEYYARNMA